LAFCPGRFFVRWWLVVHLARAWIGTHQVVPLAKHGAIGRSKLTMAI